MQNFSENNVNFKVIRIGGLIHPEFETPRPQVLPMSHSILPVPQSRFASRLKVYPKPEQRFCYEDV